MSENAKTEKILIVDDDDMINEVLSFILGESYEVHSYLSAENALAGENMSAFDVVITDVNLPGIDGIELLERIKSSNPNIPVIVITGYNDIDVAISALKRGAFDFILKPFKNDQILLSVEKARERRRLLLENIKLLDELRAKNRELEYLNEKIQARNFEIESELEIASNLQRCLFPVSFPPIRGIEFALRFKPVEKITGDFFDFILYDESRFAFIFADVSGHGVPAALYSAMVKTAIGTFVRHDSSPSQSMRDMNSFLISSQKEMSYNYATIFCGYFDLSERTLSYCNAGIPAPVLLRKNDEIQLLDPNGPFVGIFENSLYEQKTIPFGPGERLIFYTDGAFECSNAEEKILGHSNFLDVLVNIKSHPMSDIVSGLFSYVEEFSGRQRYVDDVTILGMAASQ